LELVTFFVDEMLGFEVAEDFGAEGLEADAVFGADIVLEAEVVLGAEAVLGVEAVMLLVSS